MSNSSSPKIPFSNLAASHAEILPEAISIIESLVSRSQFIGGEAVELFERAFRDFCETNYAIGTSSGSSALKLALLALGIGPGDEVITPANSFFATVASILSVGATPVLVDVNPKTALMCPEVASKAITRKTKALLPVHLFGNPVDLEGFSNLAEEAGINLIQDAAQAHGARWNQYPLSAFGEVQAYSFYPGKNLGAWGDAGAVVTHLATVSSLVSRLRDYGRNAQEKYIHHDSRGGNERLDSIQAAILKLKLRSLAQNNAKRRRLFQEYELHLALIPEVELILPLPKSESVHHLCVIRCRVRDKLKNFLESKGIETGIHYPIPLHQQPGLTNLKMTALPHAEGLSREILSLPLFPEMTTAQISQVVDAIKDFFR